MVGTIFFFTVSSHTRTRRPSLMLVIKYSVLIFTFCRGGAYENQKRKFSSNKKVSVADSGYRLLSLKVA